MKKQGKGKRTTISTPKEDPKETLALQKRAKLRGVKEHEQRLYEMDQSALRSLLKDEMAKSKLKAQETGKRRLAAKERASRGKRGGTLGSDWGSW